MPAGLSCQAVFHMEVETSVLSRCPALDSLAKLEQGTLQVAQCGGIRYVWDFVIVWTQKNVLGDIVI